MRSLVGMAALLACAVLSAAACTESALAAGSDPPASASVATAAPSAPPITPAPSASAAVPSPASLASHASAYITSVQAYELRDGDRALPADVCSATFTELEFAAHRSTMYQAQPTLAQFVAAAASISWACEMRRVADIRSGVRALSTIAPALQALQG